MHEKLTVLILALSITILTIALIWAFVFPFVAAESEQLGPTPQSLQVTPPSDAPRACWLTPATWVSLPDGTKPSTLQLIYNPQADEFVTLSIRYGAEPGDWESQSLIGLRLSPTGQLLTSEPVTITQEYQSTTPALAYSPTTNRYMAVWGVPTWRRWPEVFSHLRVQMLAADLSPIGERISLNSISGYWPSVAYNSDDGEFLIVWQEENIDPVFLTPVPTPTPEGATATPTPGNGTATPTPTPEPTIRGIVAQRVREDGTQVGSVLIPLVWGPTQPGELTSPRVIYNSKTQEYLVIWARSGQEPKLYGLRLGRTGAPLGNPITLTTSPARPYRPFLVYNGTDNQYLLVWADARGPGRLADVYGMLLSAQGEPLGEPFVIRGTTWYEVPARAVYNPVQNEYLVAWDTNLGTEIRPTLQRLSAQGEPIGEPMETFGEVLDLVTNTGTGHYLVLEGFGYRARPLGFEPHCPPTTPTPTLTTTPTPTPSTTPVPWTPTPTPPPWVIQWQGRFNDIQWGQFLSGEEWGRWLVGPWTVVVNRLTWVDEHFGRAEIGAEVWVTGQLIIVDWIYDVPLVETVADSIVILSAAEPATTSTPEPTTTVTATASATTSPTSTATTTPTITATVTPQPTQHAVYLPYVVRGEGSD